MSVRVLALVLGLCALAQAVPIYKRKPLLEDKRAVVEIYDQLEKRGSKSSIAEAVEKRSPIEKRAVVEIYDQLEKRGSKSSIAEAVEKRTPIEKRAVVEIYDQLEKRGSKSSVAEAVEKRSLPTLSIQTQPTLTYYQYDVPSTQVLYYYVLPDGSIQYMKGSSQVQVQQPQVQITQPIAQLPQLQISQPVAQESSSGGLLSFLQKPLTAAGNIIQKTGDVASDIISLPFSAGREVVAGVGLDDTAVGKLATGILNVGEGIEQTKLNILSNVAQAPFRLGADIAGAFDEEE